MPADDTPVRRRAVFYIPGFDPFPPRRYRELYRSEAAKQARISGYTIAIAAGSDGSSYGWRVQATIDGAAVETQITVLAWSDIVRDSMGGGIIATYAQMLRTAWVYLRSGALWRLAQLRKGPVIAALYPVAMLIGQLVLAMWLGLVAARLIAGLAGGAAAVVVFVAIAWVVLLVFRRLDRWLFAYYLMHDYAFSAQGWGATPQALARRLDQFAQQVELALDSGADEVLVVGHSSGAHLAVQVLAQVIKADARVPDGPALSFLSLGQVVPMVSFLPKAEALRLDLATLATSARLTWVDVSAPGDGCAFALCDPVAVSGAGGPGKRNPLVLSAAFTKTLSPARFRALRWRFFRLHFQYLCAFDRPGAYDYFQTTAGPQSLADRFAGARPSPSRIERALSGYGVGSS